MQNSLATRCNKKTGNDQQSKHPGDFALAVALCTASCLILCTTCFYAFLNSTLSEPDPRSERECFGHQFSAFVSAKCPHHTWWDVRNVLVDNFSRVGSRGWGLLKVGSLAPDPDDPSLKFASASGSTTNCIQNNQICSCGYFGSEHFHLGDFGEAQLDFAI